MALEDYRAPTRVKLSALWASTMFCYVYGDYFGLFIKGTLDEMSHGIMGPLGAATPGVLIGVSLMMALPSLMVGLSLFLPVTLCRWVSVVLGLAYTAIMGISMPGAAPFYQTLALIEMGLTLTIAAIAWRWPRS